MGLDITIHRKDVKYGSDYWFNGRNAYREVKDFMLERYHYCYGMDYPLTFNLCEELKVVIAKTMYNNINDNYKVNRLKELFYAIVNVQIDIEQNDTKWYFEATW